MQVGLQKTRTADGVLNLAETAARRIQNRRPEVIVRHVVVGRVEAWMIEEIERVEVEAQMHAFRDAKFFAERIVEADLKEAPENVAAAVSVTGLEDVAATGRLRERVTRRYAALAGRKKRRIESIYIEHGFSGVDAGGPLQLSLTASDSGLERQNWIRDEVVGAVVNAGNRAGEIIHVVGFPALGYGLSADLPAV